jgi:hypothetical protein
MSCAGYLMPFKKMLVHRGVLYCIVDKFKLINETCVTFIISTHLSFAVFWQLNHLRIFCLFLCLKVEAY